MTNAQHRAVTMLANAIVESVRETDRGLGVPAGPMYAAVMAHGVSLDQFNQIMDGLVRVGRLSRKGVMYHAN